MGSERGEQYSVLMSVYCKEKPEFLRQAMNSIWEQTVSTNDFVLVCDGPLNEELDTVIAEMEQIHYDALHIVRLKENHGLGKALNEGLQQCKNNLIARMDSDDISHPDRCEKQLAVFVNSGLSIVGAAVEEFEGSPECFGAKRVPPETHEEILKFAKKRNPFNHPCIMYRKSAVEAAGGYQDFYLLEDYYLWLRMLMNGSKGYNIQEPLLWMRAGSDMYRRRSGWKYAKSQCRLFHFMYENGFITMDGYLKSCALRSLSSCAPNCLRESLFEKLLRK